MVTTGCLLAWTLACGFAEPMLTQEVAECLERALRGLHYGSVQLVVHDDQVVRIERVERLRLTVSSEAPWTTSGQPTDPSEARQHVEDHEGL